MNAPATIQAWLIDPKANTNNKETNDEQHQRIKWQPRNESIDQICEQEIKPDGD